MLNQILKFNSKKGLTLIEVVVATGILALFLGSVIAAVIADAHNGPVNERGLIAANLAREGAQLVTQIRDTAIYQGVDWGKLENNNTQITCWGLNAGDKQLIKDNPGDNRCNYEHWRLTSGQEPLIFGIFTRKINIAKIDNATKLIIVDVSWNEGGVPKTVTVKKIITDWGIQ